MVKTAVNFLLNPRVFESPLTQKRTFLLRKGLSLEEIDVAIDRCNRLTRNSNPSSHSIDANNYSHQQMNGLPYGPVVQPMPSFIGRTTSLVTNVTLFSGFLYGAYVFYKRFIEPLIFQTQSKPHPFVTIQQQLDQLSKAMDSLKDNMSSIEINIKKQIEDEIRMFRAPQDITIHELKSELSSIKALLVNRRQFTSTPVAAIPLWQMNENKESINKTNDQNDDQNGEESENLVNGSDKGLNNSNTETNDNNFMTNGSLEIINGNEDISKSQLQD